MTTTIPAAADTRAITATGWANRAGKVPELDGLRGVAAMVVVVWHAALAFLPAQIGFASGAPPGSGLLGSPAFALINGPAAVMLFFVLSGYVLPLGYLRTRRHTLVTQAVVKRWPRLLGLTLSAAVSSYLLFRLGLYHYREAAVLTQSDWLRDFGGGDVAGAMVPSLYDAVMEGAVFAFLRTQDAYDPMLWTMRDELFGSFLTFGLSLLLTRLRPRNGWLLLALAAGATQLVEPRLIGFVVGLGLSWRHATPTAGQSLNRPAVAGLLLLGALTFGYLEPIGFYAPMSRLMPAAGERLDQIWLHTIAGLCLILGCMGSRRIRAFLASGFGRVLGRLSFPVYLFHFPVMCSLMAWLFVRIAPGTGVAAAVVLAGIATAPVLVAVGLLFARMDAWWQAIIGQASRKLLK